MDTDPTYEPSTDTWVDEIGDFLTGLGDEVIDFVTPDGLPEMLDADAMATASPPPADAGSDLPNDGFYQSLPGVDSTTGMVLDQTYQLINDIGDFGTETFGEQAWAEAGIAAEAASYGQAEGVETPAELEARFAHEDAESERRFQDWKYQQERIADAESAIDHSDFVIDQSDALISNTDRLLYDG